MFVAMNSAGVFRPVVVEIDPETGEAQDTREFLVPGITGGVVGAAYSQVGPEVALAETGPGKGVRLWLVSMETLEKRLLAEYEALPLLSGVDLSPDGEWVVYTALVDGHHQLFRVSREGGDPEQLTRMDEEGYSPQVSPDGEHVALTVYRHRKTVLARRLDG